MLGSFGASTSPVHVVASITVKERPSYVAYDSSNNYIYVSDFGTYGNGAVSVINSKTNAVVATLEGHGILGPEGIVYNPANKMVYVADESTDPGNVSVISGTAVVTTITLGGYGVGNNPNVLILDPKTNAVFAETGGNVFAITSANQVHAINVVVTGYSNNQNTQNMAFDRASGYVYIATYNGIAVVNPRTYREVTTFATGNASGGYNATVAYDPANKEVFMSTSDGLYIFGGTFGIEEVASLAGNYAGMVYSNSNRDMYVSNVGKGDMSVFNSANSKVATIHVNCNPALYEASRIYCEAGSSISIISASSNSIVATLTTGISSPLGMAFAGSNKDVYAANFGSDTVSVLSS